MKCTAFPHLWTMSMLRKGWEETDERGGYEAADFMILKNK